MLVFDGLIDAHVDAAHHAINGSARGDGRQLDQLVEDRIDLVVKCGAREYPVGDTQSLGFRRIHTLTQHDQFQGAAGADQPRESGRAAIGGQNPEFGFRQAEDRRVADDAQVAGECEFEPAAKGKSVNRSDGQERGRLQSARQFAARAEIEISP
jgi:hypothetical protein